MFQNQKLQKSLTFKNSTLLTIWKNRDTKFLLQVKPAFHNQGKFPILKKALIKWMQFMCSINAPTNGNFLKEKAKTCTKKMNIDADFKAFDG